MPAKRFVFIVVALLAASGPSLASPQSVLDRVVELKEDGTPLTIARVDGQQLSMLGQAAGVPMGFEGLRPVRRALSIGASKRPLREVLDAVVAADPRYEWREDDGVIVIRPVAAWSDVSSALHAPLAGATLDDVTASDAIDVLAQLVGVEPPSIGLDTRRFSVHVRDGVTWLEALNVIVRAHGTLTWTIEPSDPSNPYRADFPLYISLRVGAGSAGFGVPADAVLSGSIPKRSEESQTNPREWPILERIVGTGRLGDPIRAYTVNGQLAVTLANAANVPIGYESLPAAERLFLVRDGVALSGLTVREALDVLVKLDPRYEWREMDGVIVLRPVTAWLSTENPLFRLMPSVALHDVSASNVIARVSEVLVGVSKITGPPDTRTFSVDVPRGSLLDLLNTISRAHGEISWLWEDIPASERRELPPRLRHRLTFSLRRGVGSAIAVP